MLNQQISSLDSVPIAYQNVLFFNLYLTMQVSSEQILIDNDGLGTVG